MSTANNTLKVTELDYMSIRNNLKEFLRSQNEFQDFDFEGSGMGILLDVLAYNTHYMGYYLNMVGNETFLDTAQLRQSVLSHAKLMNYVPDSHRAAETLINILANPSNTEEEPGFITLEKYTRLIGRDIDGVNYPFVTLYSNSAPVSNGTYQWSNVVIKQGEVITRQFLVTPDNTKRRFTVPSMNVDTTTVTVQVQASQANTQLTAYTLSEDITEVTNQSTVYFMEEDTNQYTTIYFGDNVIGKKPDDGSIVIIQYLDTVGELANKLDRFAFVDKIGGLLSDNVRVTSLSASYGGAEKETIENIRFRAPIFYTAQNRAVTELDYETLITKDYGNIDSVAVWGGDNNDPPIYGKVFMSLRPKENFFLSNLEKERIKESLIRNRNVVTVIPEIIDPDYNYILVRGKIYYNPSLTALTASDIETYVRAAISDYETTELNKFSSSFRKSRLQQYIEQSEKSITGSDIKVLVQKRFLVDTSQTKNYELNFNMPIRKGDFSVSLSTYPSILVKDANKVDRKVFFEEVPSIASGIDRVEINNPGINYTSAPTVTIIGDGTGATAVASIAGGRIEKIILTNRGTNYTRSSILLSGGGGSGAVVTPKIETRYGILRSYYLKSTGEKVFVNTNAGTIDYQLGKVILTSLRVFSVETNRFYDGEILTVNVPIDNEIIPPLRNRIIDIDTDDPLSIQIQVVAE
jgi:hypothetical protein